MSRQITSSQVPKSKILDNKYVLGDEIGKGAYGRVYKGLDLENGDFVAIKQVSLENIAQEDLNVIMQEIDLLKILNHKNIVKYLGSLKTKSHLHIVLEYVENGSLANIIKPNKFGPFPEQLVAHYIAQVLEGLVYLHEQGVIHRDIKGANILTTKEGLVKLADFGVATKLTEADVNTHSVVGTPYWMAPEVIEMSGVCAASDIWSVGCTVIELLTCVPPYFDLQPMPALFRIVQDEHPPIPDGLSDDITDFLQQCFKKDARQRPDAKTLLSHPWIQNYRRTLQPSLPLSGSMRSTQEDALIDAELCDIDDQGAAERLNVDKVSRRETLSESADVGKCNAPGSSVAEKNLGNSGDVMSQQVSKLSAHEKACLESTPLVASPRSDGVSSGSEQLHEQGQRVEQDEVVVNGDVRSPKSKKKEGLSGKGEGKGSALPKVNLFSCGPRIYQENIQKAAKKGISSGNEVGKFSDTPTDASLEDLFHPPDKGTEARAKTSESASTSHVSPSAAAPKPGNLATRLREAIAQKKMGNGMGQANGGSLLRVMINALKEDVTDIDSNLVFEGNLPSPLQAVEFGRLVGSLRPEEPEDVIINSCQKLIAFFHQRTEQKIAFVTQHGLLPLVELLEVPKPHVICSVLQVINQIIKDNTDFQEIACLVGMIPLVMSFAASDRPRELRMEAAYFLQQLCQSSSVTLQMFIACRGIPVLVGFLEPDYVKYREMVHLAIDGMWQVFKLQRSTPRNDFCRIAAKNGILPRLISTIHSLNEATQLASVIGGSGVLPDGLVPRTFSSQPDPSHSSLAASYSGPDQLDPRARLAFDRSSSADADRPESSHAIIESSAGSRLTDPAEKFVNVVKEAARAELDHRLQRMGSSMGRHSADWSRRSAEGVLNQQDQVRPISLFEKELPSRNFSNQLDVRPLANVERHDSARPLLHGSSDKKTNGELDYLMAEYAEVSGHGRENRSSNTSPRISHKASLTKAGSYNDPVTPVSGLGSPRMSGVLSGSGVLNARTGSAASSRHLSHMVSVNIDVAKEYLEKVAELLLAFAQADTVVKSYMCSQSLLTLLFHMFNRVEPPILLKLLKCINHLSTDPNCLENLQRADAIKHLIPNLELREGPLVSQIHHEVLNALFNLCKINKKRQEQAAENGIIPHLLNFIVSDSPLKQYALPLLCDMAHASRNSREQLRAHGGLDVYLSLLDDELWSVTALDSIAVCLAHDNDSRKVEQALLKKEAVQKLVKFFQNCPERHFVHILEPFLKIITKSPRINTTLAVNGLTALLIAKLYHQDAIARLNLLKLIKAVYEHHPRPKQLIVENDLPQKLQNLIEERRDGQGPGGSGQVLVKQMATSLLKALHINTVL